MITKKDHILGNALKWMPKNLLSFATGQLVEVKWPEPLKGRSISWFAKRYKINVDEAEKPLSDYASIAEFFTRKLKAGIRPIGPGQIHPVDGLLTQCLPIEGDDLVQAKGKTFSLKKFLADEDADEKYSQGLQMTYYLCPTDYHRVHAPLDAEITQVKLIPGYLWPVNPWSVENISQLFAVNERLVIEMKTEKGLLSYVMVGATNVGKMTLSFEDKLISNQPGQRTPISVSYEGLKIKKGDELGVFNMGSTVVMVGAHAVLSAVTATLPLKTKLGESVNAL